MEGLMSEYYLGLIEQSELEKTIFENIICNEYTADSDNSDMMGPLLLQEGVNFSKMSIDEFESCLSKAADLIKDKYDTNVNITSNNNLNKIINEIFPQVNRGAGKHNGAVRVIKKISGVIFLYYKNKNSEGQYIPLKPYVFFYNNPKKDCLCYLFANKYLKKVCKK